MSSRRRPLPHDEFERDLDSSVLSHCRKVQGLVEDLIDEIIVSQLERVRVPADRRQDVRDMIAFRLARVERDALRELEALRRLRGDRVTHPEFVQRARNVILNRVVALFVELGLDEGDGGEQAGTDSPIGRTPSPSGSMAQVPLGGAEEMRMPPHQHRHYLGDRSSVIGLIWDLASHYAGRRIGSFTGLGLSVEDVAQTAVTETLARYETYWDPTKGSLFGYIAWITMQIVRREYAHACDAKRRERELAERSAAGLEQEDRLHAAGGEQHPLWSDGLFEQEREDLRYIEALRICLPRLVAAQREEVERYMREWTSGTEQQRNLRRRAFANIRAWSESILAQSA